MVEFTEGSTSPRPSPPDIAFRSRSACPGPTRVPTPRAGGLDEGPDVDVRAARPEAVPAVSLGARGRMAAAPSPPTPRMEDASPRSGRPIAFTGIVRRWRINLVSWRRGPYLPGQTGIDDIRPLMLGRGPEPRADEDSRGRSRPGSTGTARYLLLC